MHMNESNCQKTEIPVSRCVRPDGVRRYCRLLAWCLAVFTILPLAAQALADEKPEPAKKLPAWSLDSRWLPASPSSPWLPPADLKLTESDRDLDPVREAPPAGVWTLGQLVGYALRNNPQTRGAWQAARAAAAARASKGAAYLPKVNLESAPALANGGYTGLDGAQFSAGASVAANYLLLDFGGRRAGVEEARLTLLAANFSHHAAIQNVALAVIQNYFLYEGAGALVKAQEAALREARMVLEAATERHKAGVATIAEVLQAKAILSQAELSLESSQGAWKVLAGSLAAAAGLMPGTPLEIVPLPDQIPAVEADRDIQTLMTEACQRRPDLAALKAQAGRAEAHILTVRSEGLPVFSLLGNGGFQYNNRWDEVRQSYSIGAGIKIPVFTGFSQQHNLAQARAEADAARERYRTLARDVALEVWSSYYTLETASRKIGTSGDFLQSASMSYEATLGRYQAGVGSVLDTLAAQNVLENARAQVIRSRTEWFLAYARLLRDTGRLFGGPGVPPAGALPGIPAE